MKRIESTETIVKHVYKTLCDNCMEIVDVGFEVNVSYYSNCDRGCCEDRDEFNYCSFACLKSNLVDKLKYLPGEKSDPYYSTFRIDCSLEVGSTINGYDDFIEMLREES